MRLRWLQAGVPLALLLIITGLTAWWGNYPSDDAYQLLQTARQRDWLAFAQTGQPLYAATLHLLSNLARPAVIVAVSALAHWLLVMGLWRTIRPQNTQLTDWLIVAVAAGLLAIHPVQFGSLGAGFGWMAAAGLWLISLQNGRRDWQSAILTALFFATWLDWTAAVLVWLILLYRFALNRTFLPLTTVVALLGTGVVAWLASLNGLGLDGVFSAASTSSGGASGQAEIIPLINQYIYESDLYLLALPLLAVGLYFARKQPYLIIWLLWSALMVMRGAGSVQLLLIVAVVWLIAVAMQGIWTWLQTQQQFNWDVRLPQFVVGVVGICLAVACLSSLLFRHQLRPVARFEAEDAVVAYLQGEVVGSDQAKTYAASSRLAWLLNAPAHYWHYDVKADTQMISAMLPDMLILPESHWQRSLSSAVFMKERYQTVEAIGDERAKLFLKKKVAFLSDAAPSITLPVTTTFGLNLDSVQYAPQTINAGDTVDIMLHWRATEVITPFGTVLNVTNPVDGTPYAQIDLLTPNNISNSHVDAGQLVPTRYAITTVPDIPVGAYPLTLITRTPFTVQRMPLYRAGEDNVLDQVTLGYVAVPWQGETSGDVVDISYADGIRLHQADISGEAVANGAIGVKLFWQADSTPSENYTIYLHFLDEAGNFITGSDSVAFGGRYPTRGWHAGDTIPTEHLLMLPAELPAGVYRVKVGLYLPSTGERLVVTMGDGSQPGDRSALLKEFR